jgi:uncharacterized protein
VYPNTEEIIALHNKYAPSQLVYDLVFVHCTIVCDIALECISSKNLTVDRELVRAGALLHDIGVYPLFTAEGAKREDAAYITHGIEGERILKAEGYPEALWRIASHHTGTGLTADDVIQQNLPLPKQDYLAESDEERLVMYADKFHSKTTPPCFNGYEWYRAHVAGFGAEKAQAFDGLAEQFGKPDLVSLSERYGFAIR